MRDKKEHKTFRVHWRWHGIIEVKAKDSNEAEDIVRNTDDGELVRKSHLQEFDVTEVH